MVTVETVGSGGRFCDHKPIRPIFASCGSHGRRPARRSGDRRPSSLRAPGPPQPRLGEFVAHGMNCWRRTASGRHASGSTARRLFELRARGIPCLRQRAASCARLASRPIAAGRGLHPAVVRAGRSLPIRLVARGGGARRARRPRSRSPTSDCASRMFLVRAYPRETQEMVFAAHDTPSACLAGRAVAGSMDNMTTAVDAAFLGKERRFNRRFLRMCSHYLADPAAHAGLGLGERAGREPGRQYPRALALRPRLHFAGYTELNAWLEARCSAQARESAHPEQTSDKTVWEVFEAERPSLISYPGPLDGFHEVEVAVSKSSLVRFDHNRYSVAQGGAAYRPLRATPIASSSGVTARLSANMLAAASAAARPPTIPALSAGARRQAWALRNGDPFRNWDLPPALAQIRRRLSAMTTAIASSSISWDSGCRGRARRRPRRPAARRCRPAVRPRRRSTSGATARH